MADRVDALENTHRAEVHERALLHQGGPEAAVRPVLLSGLDIAAIYERIEVAPDEDKYSQQASHDGVESESDCGFLEWEYHAPVPVWAHTSPQGIREFKYPLHDFRH